MAIPMPLTWRVAVHLGPTTLATKVQNYNIETELEVLVFAFDLGFDEIL